MVFRRTFYLRYCLVFFALILTTLFFTNTNYYSSSCKTYSGTIDLSQDRNAYHTEPYQPRDQPFFYVAWVWREGPEVTTNHSLSVVRTRNFEQWENTCGQTVNLPIKLNTGEIIDRIPTSGGVLNNVQMGSDPAGRPIVSYIKYFGTGDQKTTQLFNARLMDSGWQITKMTSWTTKWELGGTGSLPSTDRMQVSFSGVSVLPNGMMVQKIGRAPADTTGQPASGTYRVKIDNLGHLFFSSEPIPTNLTDSFYKEENFNATTAFARRVQPENFNTEFVLSSKRSKSWNRWVPIRGDFDGDRINDPAIYDSEFSNFIYTSSLSKTSVIRRFGERLGLKEPVVGLWDNSSQPGIGIIRPTERISYLKTTFSEGAADISMNHIVTKEDGAIDGPRVWFKKKPDFSYRLVWDSMPQNRDRPFDCAGNALTTLWPTQDARTVCPEKFVRKLVLWRYSNVTQEWYSSDVDNIWGGAMVVIDFLTFKDHQFVAYYNQNRRLTVASRPLNSLTWTKRELDSVYDGWDSHNYITMMIDENHDIHVSGNQHSNPLNYFRSTGLDITTFRKLNMTNTQEDRVTYPTFFRDFQGRILFSYRNGASGSGEVFLNRYNIITKSWSRLNTSPLFGK